MNALVLIMFNVFVYRLQLALVVASKQGIHVNKFFIKLNFIVMVVGA